MHSIHQLPPEASAYIRDHFREEYLIEIKEEKDKHGHIYFKVEVSENDIIHHLKFDKNGKLIKSETEPTFEEDYYEGGFYGADDT